MWGKCSIYTSLLGPSGDPTVWHKWTEPAENSTKVASSKGEKRELKVEGGETEAVRYGANSYTAEAEFRIGNDTSLPIEHNDGVVNGEFAMRIVGDNPAARGVRIDRCVLSIEESADMQEGMKVKLVADVLKPKAGNSVKYETIDTGTTNPLTVVLTGDGGLGGWRVQGEVNWRYSKETAFVTGTGNRTIEYKPVAGKTLPTQTSMQVKSGDNALVATYTTA